MEMNFIVDKDAARKIVESGERRVYSEKQIVRKPVYENLPEKTFDRSVFKYREVLEYVTKSCLPNKIGSGFFFGGNCDVYDKNWDDLDDAIKAYETKTLTLNAFNSGRSFYDWGDMKLGSGNKFCPLTAVKLTSCYSSEAQTTPNPSMHTNNPTEGLGLAPGILKLVYVYYDNYNDFYDDSKSPLIRYISRHVIFSEFCFEVSLLGKASGIIVAVPPVNKINQFKKNGSLLCVALFGSSIEIPLLYADCIDDNGTLFTRDLGAEGYYPSPTNSGFWGGMTFTKGSYESNGFPPPENGDVVRLDISDFIPIVVQSNRPKMFIGKITESISGSYKDYINVREGLDYSDGGAPTRRVYLTRYGDATLTKPAGTVITAFWTSGDYDLGGGRWEGLF